MNQILVTEKLYITPELKRKKKIYKFYFILSVFVVCILTSFYIYAEYDRNKSADESKQLLADINQTLAETAEDTTIAKDDILLVVLNGTKEDSQVEDKQLEEKQNTDVATANEKAEWKTSASGYRYKIIATVQIPKINIQYTVVQGETGSLEETEALLKSSPVKYHGYDPNEVGNFCIVGHNYRNSRFFSKVPNLVVGDIVKLTDLTGRTASSQEKRLELMPVANKYEIHEVIEACRYYFEQTGRRVTFEYSLVGGVNDTDEDVRRLADLIHGMNCHVNLIPVNPIKERSYVQPDHEAILNFKNRLEKNAINVTIRREMGRDIDGACGQLRKRYISHAER